MQIKNSGDKKAVFTRDCEPVIVNCMHGIIPGDSVIYPGDVVGHDADFSEGGREPVILYPVETESQTSEKPQKKVIVPVLTSMTKYLFQHFRLPMYSYLNQCLRNGLLEDTVGFHFTTKKINRSVCEFSGITFWRIDQKNFYADVKTILTLDTSDGPQKWEGYLAIWGSAECEKGFKFSVEDIFQDEGPERKDMVKLSPYLIPYFKNHEIDRESDEIWKQFIPEALTNPNKRKAADLAEAMGLTIKYYPLYNHETVKSILFFIDDTIEVLDKEKRNKEQPVKVLIPANTIVINTNKIKRDFSEFDIFHEDYHYNGHFLFFRLQEMGNNDAMQIERQEVPISEVENKENAVFWMEKQANRGAYALMMPGQDTKQRQYILENNIKKFRHQGDRYEKICDGLAKELRLPAFRVRTRMIQFGHIAAKGAVNYVNHQRIKPFAFDTREIRTDEVTFVIKPETSCDLYAKNPVYRMLLDTHQYIYADGHMVKNDPRFVVKSGNDMMLTDWASAHVDQCCLRFIRLYVQKNVEKYVYGRMYFDSDYVKQTLFYLEDIMKDNNLDEFDARAKYISEFPKTFREAIKMLIIKNNSNREKFSEELNISYKTLGRWLKDPDRMITADFVLYATLIFQLPDWISNLLLKRAHIQLDDDDRRHLAFRYIQRVQWMDGVDKANEFLQSKNLSPLNIND